MNNRWDYAWKVFCDPSRPWGRWFIDRLTDKAYSEYSLDVADLNTEQHQYDGFMYADKFLQFNVDNEARVIHLEFQSTFAPDMCWRLLDYGLNMAKSTGHMGTYSESYRLPDAFIVNVRPSKFDGSLGRRVTLQLRDQKVTLTYPVVDVLKSIPEFQAILLEKNADKVREGIIQLANVCGGFAHAAYTDEFIRACALVAQPKAYELKGADPYIIDNEVIMVNEESKTYFERVADEASAKAQKQTSEDNFRKAVRIYMQQTGATEAEARKLFASLLPAGSDGLADMDLPDLKH